MASTIKKVIIGISGRMKDSVGQRGGEQGKCSIPSRGRNPGQVTEGKDPGAFLGHWNILLVKQHKGRSSEQA
jgi:hypothetical protein